MTLPIILLGLAIAASLYIYMAKPYPTVFIKVEKENSLFRNLKNGRELRVDNILKLAGKESPKNNKGAKFNFNNISRYPEFIGEKGEIFRNGEAFSFFIMENLPEIIGNPLFLIRPVIILNLSFLDREISDYEQRAIRELVKNAGAFKCYLWSGEELFPQHVDLKAQTGNYIGQGFKRIRAGSDIGNQA